MEARTQDLGADEIVCRLCGKKDETSTQEHVMWNCCGSVSIKEARERMSIRIKEVLVKHGLNAEAVAAALMPWRLEEKGERKGAACWRGLEEVILDDSLHSDETSTRAAVVSELAKGDRLTWLGVGSWVNRSWTLSQTAGYLGKPWRQW